MLFSACSVESILSLNKNNSLTTYVLNNLFKINTHFHETRSSSQEKSTQVNSTHNGILSLLIRYKCACLWNQYSSIIDFDHNLTKLSFISKTKKYFLSS